MKINEELLIQNSEEFLNKYTNSEMKKLSRDELLEKFIIPGLENSKNILSSLYQYQPKDKAGLIGKVKNTILNKIRNVVLNVMEKQVMKQQKFNELMYEAVKILAEKK